jgi:hypothetical protein
LHFRPFGVSAGRARGHDRQVEVDLARHPEVLSVRKHKIWRTSGQVRDHLNMKTYKAHFVFTFYKMTNAKLSNGDILKWFFFTENYGCFTTLPCHCVQLLS